MESILLMCSIRCASCWAARQPAGCREEEFRMAPPAHTPLWMGHFNLYHSPFCLSDLYSKLQWWMFVMFSGQSVLVLCYPSNSIVSFDDDPKCPLLQFQHVDSHFIHSRYGVWFICLPLWGCSALTRRFILISLYNFSSLNWIPASSSFPTVAPS